MVSNIIDQRTLTESTNATTDDTPETPAVLLDRTRQHATPVTAELFPDLPVEPIDCNLHLGSLYRWNPCPWFLGR